MPPTDPSLRLIKPLNELGDSFNQTTLRQFVKDYQLQAEWQAALNFPD